MKDKKRDQSHWTAHKGTSDKGKSINPADLPEEDAPADPSKPKSIPIGVPISPQEFKRRKERAEKTPPLPGGCGQEDPSTRQPDG